MFSTVIHRPPLSKELVYRIPVTLTVMLSYIVKKALSGSYDTHGMRRGDDILNFNSVTTRIKNLLLPNFLFVGNTCFIIDCIKMGVE